MNIYVGNLPYSTNEQALKELFGTYGEVVIAKIIKDKLTNKSKGFGFIEMRDEASGLAAISALQGTRLDGRVLKISQARNPKEREDGGRSDRGDRGDRPERRSPRY